MLYALLYEHVAQELDTQPDALSRQKALGLVG